MNSILKVRDIRVEFSVGPVMRRRILLGVAGVSFELNAGETFALVGESGSGKTTLARAINGLQVISAGSIEFNGTQINGLSKRTMQPFRKSMTMMFQDPIGSLSPRMRVRDLILEPYRIHRVEVNYNKEVKRLLSLVGLPIEIAGRYPHQMSGGQARRVGVARSIALNPQLIIADEPTAGLDVSVQGEVLNLLSDLRERLGLAMLIITHNLHVVRQVADRMGVMYLGRFVETGNTEEIFRAPLHPYTAALLSANPVPDPARKSERISLPAEVPSPLNRPVGCEFHTRCPWAQDLCAKQAPKADPARRSITCHFPLSLGSVPPHRVASNG